MREIGGRMNDEQGNWDCATGLRTLAIELICLLVVVDVDVAGGGGIGDCTGNPLSCSRNGRNIKDCGPDMLSWLFVI